MSEGAASSAEPTAGNSRFPRAGPRFAPARDRGPAEEAAWALFQRTERVEPGAADGQSAGRRPVSADPRLAVTLSELRRHVALQTDQLERAMDEVHTLNRRLESSRARAASAERAVARERMLRGHQASESARRLSEHERTIARLSAQLRVRREAIAASHEARAAALERQLAARELMDERVAGVIAAARKAVAQVRGELANREGRIANLQSALARERERRTAIERRLAGMAASEPPRTSERRRPLREGQATAEIGGPAPVAGGAAHRRIPDPTGDSDVATACRKLEQELAARHALEVQAARLIGRLNRQLGAEG